MDAILAVTRQRLDPGGVVKRVGEVSESDGVSIGGIATFVGVVRGRNLGRCVLHLEYEAYEPLALRAFERIADEIRDRWRDSRVAIQHRVGRVEVGEASIVIAAASPHRAEAFAACRYAIERVKQIAPVWKHEYFEGGDVWIEGATANPDDDTARQQALQLADCAPPT